MNNTSNLLNRLLGFFKINLIALLALFVSIWVFYDNQFDTDIDVFVGRQARLYVLVDSSVSPIARPTVLLTLTFVNTGGRVGVVTDTRLSGAFQMNDRSDKTKMVLESLREVENILFVEKADSTQKSIAAVPVLGKSTVIKSYVFVPPDGTVWDTTSHGFKLVFEVETKQADDWSISKTYSISSNSGVWCDLYLGGKFNSQVVEVSQTKCKD